jgi:cytochrome c556
MIRFALVAGALLLGVGAVMAQQDVAVTQQNLMKVSLGKPMYGVLGKMLRGDIPYDQAAVDTALTDMEAEVTKIADVFKPNPKEQVANATYGSSQKIWQNKADFDSKIPAVSKAIADQKGKITDAATLKVSFNAIQDKCNGCHDDYRLKLK